METLRNINSRISAKYPGLTPLYADGQIEKIFSLPLSKTALNKKTLELLTFITLPMLKDNAKYKIAKVDSDFVYLENERLVPQIKFFLST